MSYDGEGPSLTVNRPRTQKELSREETEEDLYNRIMLLNERRPIIMTLKFSDKHMKILDSVLLNKLKLDGEFELEVEMVGEELIKGYKAIREKTNPGVLVLPIRLKGKYNYCALVDTRSNINVMPYRIYELLGRDKVKPKSNKITMLDHSKAKPMGRLLDVLCQVGVITILANFMLLDIPTDRDMPIIVGRSFLYACGEIMNTVKGKMSTFDGFVHQQDDVVKVRSNHEESDSDDDEEYLRWEDKRNFFTSEAWRRAFDTNEPIYTELCHEFYSAYEFDEEVADEELIRKKLIKFRLRGCGHSLTLLEFALRLGIYNSAQIRKEGFEFVTRLAKKMGMLTDEVLDGMSAPIYCRSLDATTFRELIGPNGRLIDEDPSPGVPRVAMPRPPRPTMQDLSDRMGRMEIRQDVLERMSRRQLYHNDRYAGVFEFMGRHYGVPLDGAYAPLGYAEQ
ncbi:retrotransposon ORF1 [Tanacetum coccineum]